MCSARVRQVLNYALFRGFLSNICFFCKADFRGPGVRHQFEESGDDYELDLDNRTRGFGGRSGRIILLGDGTEVLTDADDTEMFDHDEEDRDLENQAGNKIAGGSDDSKRGEREDTPGPQGEESKSPDTMDTSSGSTPQPSDHTSTDTPFKVKAAADSDIPSKLTNPPTSKK